MVAGRIAGVAFGNPHPRAQGHPIVRTVAFDKYREGFAGALRTLPVRVVKTQSDALALGCVNLSGDSVEPPWHKTFERLPDPRALPGLRIEFQTLAVGTAPGADPSGSISIFFVSSGGFHDPGLESRGEASVANEVRAGIVGQGRKPKYKYHRDHEPDPFGSQRAARNLRALQWWTLPRETFHSTLGRSPTHYGDAP